MSCPSYIKALAYLKLYHKDAGQVIYITNELIVFINFPSRDIKIKLVVFPGYFGFLKERSEGL